MKTVVISCKVTERELRRAMEETGSVYDVILIDDGLHDIPKKLNAVLNETLLGLSGADRVLMTMGECGGAVTGLKTGDFELIFPRTDDCITLLLGAPERRKELSRTAAYFITEGWLIGSRNLVTEYEYSVRRFGERTAQSILKTMFANYRTLGLLDTGCENMEQLYARTEKTAVLLGLERTVIPATLEWMKQLLTGPWPEDRFSRIPPHSYVSAGQTGINR